MTLSPQPRSGPALPALIPDPEVLALALGAHPDYRVLRRLAPRLPVAAPAGAVLRTALFVDCETTGLDTVRDEVIEVACASFSYSEDGQVLSVDSSFEALREPTTRPITAEVTRLTGITPEMVAGRTVDLASLAALVETADLIVAHNAGFDRPMLERLCPAFAKRPWACSLRDVDWSAEGCEGGKLTHIASWFGFFYDAHRAVTDCMAGIEVLAHTLPRSGVPSMLRLLESARQDTFRIRADGAGFSHKDELKAHRYRWSPGMGCWHKDVLAGERDEELAWLERHVLRTPVRVPPRRISACDRYSVRAGANTWLAGSRR